MVTTSLTTALAVAAILLYFAVAARTALAILARTRGEAPGKRHGLYYAFVPMGLHAVVLYQGMVTSAGLNLGVFNAASLVAWLVALLGLFGAFSRSMENLTVVLLPLAAVAVGLEALFSNEHVLPASTPFGLRAHVLLSIAAYSLLAVAALQALVLAVEDHLLRSRRPLRAIQVLPPLQMLESLMFQLIAVGFFTLSLGLVSGLMFLTDIFGQHLVHKTVLSLIAWMIFAVLLVGRYRRGWRGRIAIRYTLGGFLSLMLAYFGSKVVLELILHRV